MFEYGFIDVDGSMIEECDVKFAFEEAEGRLSVLDFEVPTYVFVSTLESVLRTKRFNKYSDFDKKQIIGYIVENY